MKIEDILDRLQCEAEGKCLTPKACKEKQACVIVKELEKVDHGH